MSIAEQLREYGKLLYSSGLTELAQQVEALEADNANLKVNLKVRTSELEFFEDLWGKSNKKLCEYQQQREDTIARIESQKIKRQGFDGFNSALNKAISIIREEGK